MPSFDVRPESFSYSTPIRVLWSDMDALGHVNHAKYITYFEMARCEFFLQHDIVVRNAPEGPVVAQAECRYRRAVSYPATVRVYLRATSIRQSAFRMEYAVYNEETSELAADGETLIIWTNYAEGRRAPLPAAWIESLGK